MILIFFQFESLDNVVQCFDLFRNFVLLLSDCKVNRFEEELLNFCALRPSHVRNFHLYHNNFVLELHGLKFLLFLRWSQVMVCLRQIHCPNLEVDGSKEGNQV